MKSIVIFVLAFIVGCSSSLPVPDASVQSRDLSVTYANLVEGRTLYAAKCSGCHGLYLPSQFSSDHWRTVLPVMTGKAKLSDSVSKRIEQYILQYSAN